MVSILSLSLILQLNFGAKLYELLKFTNCSITQGNIKIELRNTHIEIAARIIPLKLIVFPHLTGNHTLLGCNFLD